MKEKSMNLLSQKWIHFKLNGQRITGMKKTALQIDNLTAVNVHYIHCEPEIEENKNLINAKRASCVVIRNKRSRPINVSRN